MSKRKKKSNIKIFSHPLLVFLLGSIYFYYMFGQEGLTSAIKISIIFVISISVFSYILRRLIKFLQYSKSTITEIDKMSGIEFEEYLQEHFRENGYRVSTTSITNDFGADLILKKNGETTIVQAKRYSGKIGNKAVQEIVAAKAHYNAKKAMVITNSYFTSNAIQLAKDNQVIN